MKKCFRRILAVVISPIMFFTVLFSQGQDVYAFTKAPVSSDAKIFRFYDAQSKKWYNTKINPKIKKHSYDWSRLVNKKKKIRYRDSHYTIRKGIDVSRHNGTIHWKKVKSSGIDFAFIRIGYRGYRRSGGLYIDEQFQRNIKMPKKPVLMWECISFRKRSMRKKHWRRRIWY